MLKQKISIEYNVLPYRGESIFKGSCSLLQQLQRPEEALLRWFMTRWRTRIPTFGNGARELGAVMYFNRTSIDEQTDDSSLIASIS